jgi:formate hydrogenlyase subunit 6/NADH:ubiquinone oxidoreductase subunit I
LKTLFSDGFVKPAKPENILTGRNMRMQIVELGAEEFLDFVDSLIRKKTADIIGPVPKSGRFSFEVLDKAADLCLDYDETTMSPRKFLMPAHDTLLTYAPRDALSCEPVHDHTERIIIGIHPGDLTAIALYDKTYCSGVPDEHYKVRREKATLIGLYPTRGFKYRFTSSMIKESDPYIAADLLMTDMGNGRYCIEVVTEKGKKLIGQSKAKPASDATVKALTARKTAIKDIVTLPVKRDELPKLLAGKERHETFKTRGDKCYSCGSCVLVCPTCVCFDVKDDVDLSLASGSRSRTWDGCTLENFATVAGNHNFRKNAEQRVRHRLFRKTVYLQERFGITGCVGCGRCTQACTADIASIADMIGDIAGKGK